MLLCSGGPEILSLAICDDVHLRRTLSVGLRERWRTWLYLLRLHCLEPREQEEREALLVVLGRSLDRQVDA